MNDMNTVVWPKRLYTQQEVETIKKETETQTVDQKIRQDNRAVAKLVKKSNRILLSMATHAFPIDIFPDILNVEEGRITIIDRHFLSSEVHSIDIKDISNVFINTTFFFSQLVIISKTFEENEIKIGNLRTSEAIYARRIIEGLRVFVSKQIDTSSYTEEELLAKLEKLSTTKIVT